MSLTDEQVDRYSRQIILPEVGGRGQERLLAARVLVAGDDAAADAAVTLLGRAGVGTLDVAGGTGAPPADVIVDLTADTATRALLTRGRQAGRPFVLGERPSRMELVVRTVVGRPCAACVGSQGVDAWLARPAAHLEAPAASLLGALAATETLRVLLLAPHRGRITRVSMLTGDAFAADLAPTDGCELCEGGA